MLSARALRAPRIVVLDVDDHDLFVAKSLGPHDIVLARASLDQDTVVEKKNYWRNLAMDII